MCVGRMLLFYLLVLFASKPSFVTIYAQKLATGMEVLLICHYPFYIIIGLA